MLKPDKTYQPIQTVTVKAVEDLPAFRFVSHLGSVCAENQKALGVSDVNWLKDEYSSVITLGTIAIETTTTINIGSAVATSTGGKAKPAGSGNEINGRALDSCNGAGFIKISIVP
ncbi:MAG TPA: DUF2190 family protein [Candidatus Kapabacteria bacterium]|nr:DUF2190 family protein [Candidatus Kapabacteria bacterium]